ncbi:MAG: bifunctional precorrin-2 dehydrogenase/sirohydrochlorin ferrochelatase [Candidatus Omnitrophica bacterium]|nr:bifunctional precorrin-2 dehydrogenase/sirohydrochlorin ferrochelatase [Candidatus Omnitrophota bacterium]
MIYYPAFLNLKAKKVILFGGGEIALRKARSLVQTGAKLTAASRDFSEPFLHFAKRNRIRIQRKSSIPKTFKGVMLVTAATSDSVFNRTVYERCVRDGVLVNVVDDPKHCTFIVPSVLRRGPLQIAISTGGASPLLSKILRQKLEKQFGREYAQLAKRLGRERKKTKGKLNSMQERKQYFKKFIRSEFQTLGIKV